MEAAEEGKELVIKMAQKNKETQTTKLGQSNWFAHVCPAFPTVEPRFTAHPLGPNQAFVPRLPSSSCQFYMNREQELYRRACRLKGIRLQLREDYSLEPSDEKLPKGSYRYTLEEMKSLNPYRLVDLEE